MKVYAFVPAKGNSERVENKNKRILNGEMLYVKALKTLLQCKEIDKVFLDTESEEMYELVDYLPIEFMKRSPDLASNKTDGHKMFLNEVNSYPGADIYVQLLCTSPFVKPSTIDNAIKFLKENPQYDSSILMKKDKFYLWENGKPLYDINHIPNSVDLSETIIESMGLYISTRESAIKTNRRYGDNPHFVYGELEELIDINTPEDLLFAQTFANGLQQKESAKFKLLKHFLTSALLADIIDDFSIKYGECCGGVVNGLQPNIINSKLLGRASTIKLRKLKENEDFTNIYNALEHYKYIGENDIIIVDNELSDFAYFGDLNARLAIRAGAQGAIINGATRDKDNTITLNFPVYSKKYNAVDVRRRATLDYINKPISLDGVIINPQDLIFADECALVVIYKKFENEIFDFVFNKYANEKNIVNDILQFKDINEIKNVRGEF